MSFSLLEKIPDDVPFMLGFAFHVIALHIITLDLGLGNNIQPVN
jgi:hypothetical protein